MEDGGLEDGSAGNACGAGVRFFGLRLARDSARGVARGSELRPVRAVGPRPARALMWGAMPRLARAAREPDWVACRAVGWGRRALYRIRAGAEKQGTRSREQGNERTRKRS